MKTFKDDEVFPEDLDDDYEISDGDDVDCWGNMHNVRSNDATYCDVCGWERSQ